MKRILYIVLITLLFSGCHESKNPLTEVVELKYRPARENRFATAIIKGDLEKVKSLSKNRDLEDFVTDNEKPVHLALKNGREDVALFFLEKGVDPDSQNSFFETPLYLSVQKGFIRAAKKIVKKGGNLNPYNSEGLTPIHVAVLNKNLKMVRFLIENGADYKREVYKYSRNRREKYKYRKETPLSLAIKYSTPEIAEVIIDKTGPDRRSNRDYPIDIAISADNYKVVEILLKKGANPNIKRYNPFLFNAVKKGRKKIFKLLIENGAEIWDRSSYRAKNIFYSIVNGRKEGFLSLISPKVVDNKSRKDLFQKSIRRGFPEGVKYFYSSEFLDYSNKSSNSLYRAVNSKNTEIVKFLIEKGANPETVVYGRSVLFQSAINRSIDIAMILLNTGKVNPNFRDRNRWTPLHVAVSGDNLELVKKLISLGAKVDAKNVYNITPLISSFYSKNPEIFRFLVKKGARFRGEFQKGMTAVYYAAKAGNIEALEFLDKKGLSFDVKDKEGSYPYFHTKIVKVIEYYKKKGISLNHMNKRGQTALYYASYRGYFEIVKYLVENGCDYKKYKGIFNNPIYVAEQKRKKKIISYFYGLETERIKIKIKNIKYSPKVSNRRFIKKKGYVIDLKTNLMWADKDNGKNISFNGSVNYCRNYKAGGYTDFRVPKIKELKTLYIKDNLNRYGYHVDDSIALRDYSIWSDREKGSKGARFTYNKGKITWYGKNKTVFGRALPVRGKLSKGNYKEIKRAIDQRDKDGKTYLHQAVLYNSKELIKLLIDKGADVDGIDIKGDTPLHFAVKKGNIGIAEYLIDNKASINRLNQNFKSPLHTACFTTKPDRKMIDMLIRKGADLNTKSNIGNTVLHELVTWADNTSRWRRKKTCEIIRDLLEKGADPKIKNNLGQTALNLAERRNFKDVAQVFYKFDVKKSGTELHIAALENNNWRVRKILKKDKSALNMKDGMGRTPLHWAALKNNSSMVTTLIRNGARVDLTDLEGKTPLYFAVKNSNYYIARDLVKKGADPKRLFNKDNLLHVAVYGKKYFNKRLLEFLIKERVNINGRNSFGKTPLHYVAETNNTYVAGIFLKNRANLEVKDKFGWTPLFSAVQGAKSRMVIFLIDKGANRKARDKRNKTPYMAADKKRLGSRAYNKLK